MSILCSMVGASFAVAAVAQVLRSKKGITAFGNAQVSTAQSQFGGSSAIFDGTGDYLEIAGSSDFHFGTAIQTWTIEGWLRLPTLPNAFRGIISSQDGALSSGGGNNGWGVYINNNNRLTYIANAQSSTFQSTTGDFTTNTWTHWAVVRNGSSLKMFVNGTETFSITNYANREDTNRQLLVGRAYNVSSGYNGVLDLNGNLDEIRLSKTARYTANFTPSTTPFVNDANTLLLIHANGTNASTFFEDDNGVGRSQVGITAVGNAQISTAQSQFGGSSYLGDGTGDYLIANNVSTFLGNFTIECWFRTSSVSSDQYIITADGVGTALPGVAAYLNGNALKIFSNHNGSWTQLGNVTVATISTNIWYHLSISRSGTTWYASVNGTITNLGTYSGSISISGDVIVGALTWTSVVSYSGHIDEVRVSNSARYTSNFTAPAAPFVNDANTLLLIHADGTNASTVFRDDNGITGKNITAFGNAQISTAQSQFGGASALFAGSDIRTVSNEFAFGNNDFTIECWVRFTGSLDNKGIFHLTNVFLPSNNSGLAVAIRNTGWHIFANGETSTGVTAALNTWYHIALVRIGTLHTLYINGVAAGSRTVTADYTTTTNLSIGVYWNYSFVMAGNVDEFRISNTARYTANFTPSTTAFTPDANTLLLLHMDGANASTAFIDSASRSQTGVQATTNAMVSTAQSKFGGASLRLLFSNSVWNYLEIKQSSSLLNFGTADWTVEGWFRFDNTNTDLAIWTGGTTNGDIDIRRTNDNLLRIGRINVAWDLISGATGILANTWYHLAFVKGSGTLRIYVNGTQVGSASNNISYSITTQLRIGAQSVSSLGMSGYIDDLRASDIARYTDNFTAPTEPFVNDRNTLLLLHMDGTNNSTVFFDDNGQIPFTPT